MTQHAIILGAGSDIGNEISLRLIRDGWSTDARRHDDPVVVASPWDLVVCCYGVVDPIGNFWMTDVNDWENSIFCNTLLALRRVRALYPHRRTSGASVCFFSGAGTSGPAPTYSAYCAAKVMLVKATELLDDESPDCKFFVLGPGIVRTKIHSQTLDAGKRAANIERVVDFVSGPEQGTSHDDIYACLMACHAASKAAVGGRNIYVPGDDWTRLEELAGDPDALKLRRHGDASLLR